MKKIALLSIGTFSSKFPQQVTHATQRIELVLGRLGVGACSVHKG